MNKLLCSPNPSKLVDKLLSVFCLMAIISVIGIRFFMLNRGMIFSDDAWYAVLLRDVPKTTEATRFFLLFKHFTISSIVNLRTLALLIYLTSALIFSFSIHLYQNVYKYRILLFCIGSVFLSTLSIPDIQTPNYIIINQIIGFLSSSLLLLYSKYQKSYFLPILSFILSFLYASQITCLLAVPIFGLCVCCVSRNRLKDVFLFCSGIIIFIMYYLTCVESISEICEYFKAQMSGTIDSGANEYGIYFLMEWILVTFYYYIKCAMGALLMYLGIKNIEKHIRNIPFRYILYVIFICLVFKYINGYILPVKHSGNLLMKGVLWIFLFYLIILRRKYYNRKTWYVIGVLTIMPAILSFGTNVTFDVRQCSYLSLISPLVFVILQPSHKIKALLLVVFGILFFQFVESYNGKNWFGDSYKEMNVPISTIGVEQNVKISQKDIDHLLFVRRYVSEGDFCFLSNKCWGYVYFLNLKPASYAFRLPDADVLEKDIVGYLQTSIKKSVPLLLDDGYEEKYRLLKDSEKILVKDIDSKNGIHIYICSLR